MKLYYTIISKEGDLQEKPGLSLGGFKALNPVRNSEMNNLFPDISPISISNYNQNRYAALMLVNDTDNLVLNVKLYFTYNQNCYSKFRVAAVELATDSEGFEQMEHIDTSFSKPLMAEFFEAEGVDNAVELGDLPSGDKIGLWIERELLLDIIKEDQELIYEPDPDKLERYKERILDKLDNISINISWD
jgi:hypothetical protein